MTKSLSIAIILAIQVYFHYSQPTDLVTAMQIAIAAFTLVAIGIWAQAIAIVWVKISTGPTAGGIAWGLIYTWAKKVSTRWRRPRSPRKDGDSKVE